MKFIIFMFLIFLIIILLFYYINKYFSTNEHITNKNNIIFLKKDELYEILKKDEDNYYSKFYKNDFTSRKIKNINEYLEIIKSSVDNINDYEKNKITLSIKKADDFFKNIDYKWFNGNKAIDIKWIIGLVKDKTYEAGLPHTRHDIIIISKKDVNNFSDEKLIKTFIHEKIHLYQKKYKNDVELYLNEFNFKKIKLRDENDNTRANPDLDNFIYADNNNNQLKAVFNNNPSSIEDIKYIPYNNQSSEHPFEKMAIFIENLK